MSSKTAVLYAFHYIDDQVVDGYRRLLREAPEDHEVILLYDAEKLPRRKVERIAEGPALGRDNVGWQKFKRPGRFRNRIPGNEDADLLVTCSELPGYTRYWRIEYDVAYTGHWGKFFRHFSVSSSDLLTTNVLRRAEMPEWSLWETLEPPEGIEVTSDQLIRAFMPIARVSVRALGILEDEYRKGWAGHWECVLPTVLSREKCVLEDIGGTGGFVAPGNEGRFYESNHDGEKLVSGTFLFRPPFREPGNRPDTLWHPVKSGRQRSWDQSGRWANVKRRLRTVFR